MDAILGGVSGHFPADDCSLFGFRRYDSLLLFHHSLGGGHRSGGGRQQNHLSLNRDSSGMDFFFFFLNGEACQMWFPSFSAISQ